MAAMIRTASSPRTTITRMLPFSMRERIAHGAWERIEAAMIREVPLPPPRWPLSAPRPPRDAAVLYEGADRERRLGENRGGDDQGDPVPEAPLAYELAHPHREHDAGGPGKGGGHHPGGGRPRQRPPGGR